MAKSKRQKQRTTQQRAPRQAATPSRTRLATSAGASRQSVVQAAQQAKRRQEMIKWLGGGKPMGSFSFTKSWTDGGKTFAQGNLTIHGVSKTISFPYSVKREGEWATIDGTAKMDYQNFSLPIIKTMVVMTVDPKLTINFHLVGKVKQP